MEREYSDPAADQGNISSWRQELPPDAPERYNFLALVMTSGNLAEEPIVIENEEALKRLSPLLDYFLLHNRDIYMRVDDSVVRVFEDQERQIRRSRGYVPLPLDLGGEMPEILACGGELKNTFTLTKGKFAIVSQHIGDLENFEALAFFKETLANLKNSFRVKPEIVAYDLHPDYLSTKFALEQKGVELIGVQHHYAHLASCLADNGVDELTIGVIWDGTGFGLDGHIWGGEFLVGDARAFRRAAHFAYVPLPGGEKAILEPYRTALSYLYRAFGPELRSLDIPFLTRIDPKNIEILLKMIDNRVNCPLSCSCGRLFDAVSSLIGLRDKVTFEAEAAIDLEMVARENEAEAYPVEILEGAEPWLIDFSPMVAAIVRDLKGEMSQGIISARFHRTLANVVLEICLRLRRLESINKVALSGGVFQNMVLLRWVVELLRANNFEVLVHRRVPANDGGLSLGQAVIAARIFGK